MTVLITGAGLVGTHTAKLLLDQGVGVLLYDLNPSRQYIESVVGSDQKLLKVERGDVRDLPRVIDLMLRAGVTRILHTASIQGPQVDENPSLAFQVNLAGTLNLIEAARIRSLARIVLVSSNAVYGGVRMYADGPIAEQEPITQPPGFYAAYKAMAEMLALAYHRSAGVNAIIVRPCAVYGRGGFLGGAQHGRRINDLLLAALHEPIGGSEISVDVPTAERVYAFDAALAIREAVFVEKPTTRIYNVGSGEVVTPASLAAAINAAVPGARAVGAAREDSPVRTLDTTLARLELAYTPQWPLQHAVADYVSSLRTHGPYPG